MEEVMDYLVENTNGEINNEVHDLINAYLRLEEELEDKERELEDLKDDYQMLKDNSRPLTQAEMSGVPQWGPID